MAIQHRHIDYRDGDSLLEGRLSYDDAIAGSRPGILVSHTIAGRGALEESKAERLAEQGYAAFALDLYVWLTYRMSYLRRPTEISWRALAAQFGAEYGQARDFKRAFLRHARAVATVYPAARLTPQRHGLLLQPSPSHVLKASSV